MPNPKTPRLLELYAAMRKEREFHKMLIREKQSPEHLNLSIQRMQEAMDKICNLNNPLRGE